MEDKDFLLALELQKEFDREFAPDEKKTWKNEAKEKWKHRQTGPDLNSTSNLVHPEWETLDPTPDVNSLFAAFDNKFFQGRLKCVTLEWSKRMYSCAGICYSRRNRLGMAITIRLSEPLLKLRSRKDLVETLIHEMIHAYCSVLGIREGNGGHGPNFKKIMHGINKVAGTNITVYHTFHDEVNTYKTHWWRCNGICQNRKPFFGYVKRTSNRAPGPNDIWWRQHLQSCGGTYLKVREPGKKPPKTKKENNPKRTKAGKDIRKFFPTERKQLVTNNSPEGDPIVIDDGRSSTPKKESQKQPFGVNKVIGLKDLDGSRSSNMKTSTAIVGSGYSLNSSSSNATPSSSNKMVDRDRIRDIWSKKFGTEPSKRTSDVNNPEENSGSDGKRRKLDVRNGYVSSKSDDSKWTAIDDEIMLKENVVSVIDISSDDDNDDANDDNSTDSDVKPYIPQTPVQQTQQERQTQIKQEIIDSSDCDLDEDDIELIDDEYNDDLLNTSVELADTSLIDDLFGEDTLLREFKKENACFASNSRYHADPKNDIVSCPVCQDKVTREQFPEHLDGCIGISVKIVPSTSKRKATVPFYQRKGKCPPVNLTSENVKQVLKNAGYQENEINEVLDDENEPQERSTNRRQGLDTSTHQCPVCGREVDVEKINEHLDSCLPKN